jgi:hypothetical protein
MVDKVLCKKVLYLNSKGAWVVECLSLLISENEFKITGMFFAPIPISNVKSFKTHLWPRARVSRHTYGQGFHDTPMAKGFKTHLWPRVSRHTYGQEFQDTPMAKGFKTHLWPRVSRHTYGQGFQDTPMAKGFIRLF